MYSGKKKIGVREHNEYYDNYDSAVYSSGPPDSSSANGASNSSGRYQLNVHSKPFIPQSLMNSRFSHNKFAYGGNGTCHPDSNVASGNFPLDEFNDGQFTRGRTFDSFEPNRNHATNQYDSKSNSKKYVPKGDRHFSKRGNQYSSKNFNKSNNDYYRNRYHSQSYQDFENRGPMPNSYYNQHYSNNDYQNRYFNNGENPERLKRNNHSSNFQNKNSRGNRKKYQNKHNSDNSKYSYPNSTLNGPSSYRSSASVKNNYSQDDDAKDESDNISMKFNSAFSMTEGTQRENMIDLLSNGFYECLVCCDKISQQDSVWSCNNCYNCFHLKCIKKWSSTSKADSGWRCPACQELHNKVPNIYYCFCKKMRDPLWKKREVPHSCGEVCSKKRKIDWCTHKCTLLCHPGPCPDCTAYINRKCACGKSSKDVRCSSTEAYLCDQQCSQFLDCSVHMCEQNCHVGSCDPCKVIVEKFCFCGKESKKIPCSDEMSKIDSYACGAVCDELLGCGKHRCGRRCHQGLCDGCPRDIEAVTVCPCGKMTLLELYEKKKCRQRVNCNDPIPLCGNVCNKTLKCGSPGNYHSCKSLCHEGPCPSCPDETDALCRCGFMNKRIPCLDLKGKADEVTCLKQCKKVRTCGRHKCGRKCCIDLDHVCERICNLSLKCNRHKCQEICHRGSCARCLETSFEELTCHCGASVLFPPIQCGTVAPACDLPCRRPQSCSHPVTHSCHAEDECPLCTTLGAKSCFGGHKMMKSTPCYLKAISCGEMCAKKMPCGLHVCQKVCHEGPCSKKNCDQKCTKIRSSCDHPCANVCHSGPCPDKPCKEPVVVSCICGNVTAGMSCAENNRQFRSSMSSKIALELRNQNQSDSVDISELFSGSNKADKLKRLDCNEECGRIARNRRLALALQIENPDARENLGEAKFSSMFSDSVKEAARSNPEFAQMIHSTLNDLVVNARQSGYKSRSHSFKPMNLKKRRFIHEYSKYFGCESEAFDMEPQKNVVVTAYKNVCRLPPVSVLDVIKGQRKVPTPVFQKFSASPCEMKRLERSSSVEKKDEASPAEVPQEQKKTVIDFFDFE